MVVHEDSDRPEEVAIIRKPHLEPMSFVIVKNHVRELINTEENELLVNENKEISDEKTESVIKKKRKSNKKFVKERETTTNTKACDDSNSDSQIDKNDLQELKSVYLKCKEVMRKIESKYGHLLDLESEGGPISHKKRKLSSDKSSEEECYCKFNRKIVFDDDGKQMEIDVVPEKHICVKKVNTTQTTFKPTSSNISVEYIENEIKLPENLVELDSLLQDPNIENALRYKIINKMRSLRQEYVCNLRFNKHALIEKVKVNPDEVLAFKGTNLSTIPGYL